MEEKNNNVRKTRKRVENSNETIRKKEKVATKTRGEQKGGERTTPRVTSSRRTNSRTSNDSSRLWVIISRR